MSLFESALIITSSKITAVPNTTKLQQTLNLQEIAKRFALHISHNPVELYESKTLIISDLELKKLLLDLKKELLKKQSM